MSTNWSNDWPGFNKGVAVPLRVSYVTAEVADSFVARDYVDAEMQQNTLVAAEAELCITTWGHDDPVENFEPGDVPRAAKFLEKNTLRIAADCKQPPVPVSCQMVGIVPSESNPIHWRLEAGHVFCRRRGKKLPPTEEHVFREWRGVAYSENFTLFQVESDDLLYEYPDGTLNKKPPPGPVVGGHLVLTVAAKPHGIDFWVRDVVHIRVIGSNPGAAAYEPVIDAQLSDRSIPTDCCSPLRNILMAELEQEVGDDLRHFSPSAQTDATLGKKNTYVWPPDPANYPTTTYDFGIGVGQLTSEGYAVRDIFWDWGLNTQVAAWIMYYEKLHGSGHGMLMKPDAASKWVIGLWMCEEENWSGVHPRPSTSELDALRKIAGRIGEYATTKDAMEGSRKTAQNEYDKAKRLYDAGDKTKRDAYERARVDLESAAANASQKKTAMTANMETTQEAKDAVKKAYEDAEKSQKAAETAYSNAETAYPPAAELEQKAKKKESADKDAASAKATFDADEASWTAFVDQWQSAFCDKLPRTWRNLAITGWYAYNGSGPHAVTHTRRVEVRPHGQIGKVAHTPLPQAMMGLAGKELLARMNSLKITESSDRFLSEWEPLCNDEEWMSQATCPPEATYRGLWLFEWRP